MTVSVRPTPAVPRSPRKFPVSGRSRHQFEVAVLMDTREWLNWPIPMSEAYLRSLLKSWVPITRAEARIVCWTVVHRNLRRNRS